MNLISVENISKYNGDKLLFDNISFGINEGDKTALIGVNGCGKTTLLKILAGIEITDKGNIYKNNELKLNYLEQIPKFDKNHTIYEHILSDNDLKSTLLKKYTKAIETGSEEIYKIIEDMEKHDVFSYESEIKSTLSAFGIDNFNYIMGELSFGTVKRVAIVKVLLNESNFLLLDEPTNHLDIDTIVYLQEYLQKTKKTVFMVTHDRYLLDSVCNIILEIDKQTLFSYAGNYSFYLEKKAEYEQSLIREQDKTENILRTELDWLRRGPCARGTKQKARIMRVNDMQNVEKIAKQDDLALEVAHRRMGKKIVELINVSKKYGNKSILNDFSYNFKQNEKIGIVGGNGTGKTTFLNIITGMINPDSGTVDTSINTVFGYFDQTNLKLDDNKLLIDYIKDIAEVIELADGTKVTASRMLERFLFSSKLHYTQIEKLSGGERRRLYLLSVLMKNPNFLILDEPTNDLDIKTLTILEDFLLNFKGCLIIVSHDRYFLDKVIDELFIFEGNSKINGFVGNCSEYLEYKKETEAAKNIFEKQVKVQPEKPKNKNKISYKEKIELQNIEKEIEQLENESNEIEQILSNPNGDLKQITKHSNRYNEIKAILTEKYERWEYLSLLEQ